MAESRPSESNQSLLHSEQIAPDLVGQRQHEYKIAPTESPRTLLTKSLFKSYTLETVVLVIRIAHGCHVPCHYSSVQGILINNKGKVLILETPGDLDTRISNGSGILYSAEKFNCTEKYAPDIDSLMCDNYMVLVSNSNQSLEDFQKLQLHSAESNYNLYNNKCSTSINMALDYFFPKYSKEFDRLHLVSAMFCACGIIGCFGYLNPGCFHWLSCFPTCTDTPASICQKVYYINKMTNQTSKDDGIIIYKSYIEQYKIKTKHDTLHSPRQVMKESASLPSQNKQSIKM